MGKTNASEAFFGGGCFWCTEAVFSNLKGVQKITPGYSGGNLKNPSYNDVVTGETGHAELIKITYNKQEISYEQLLDVFFSTHDPTTLNRQGADIGTQYRSVIFYTTNEEKTMAENKIQSLNRSNIFQSAVVTEVSPLTEFYEAEKYHRNYYKNNKQQPYCQFVIAPKIEKRNRLFNELIEK